VRAILVNIFAGINRCDWVAQGIVHACREISTKVPLVVRLAGTNVEAGRQILAQSSIEVITADTLVDAAEKVVAASRAADELTAATM
jgi:malate-CoA ligase subunit beta